MTKPCMTCAFAILTALSACSGGGRGSSIPPSAPDGVAKGTGSAVFVIKVPESTSPTSASPTRSAQGVRPQYVSPATQSITVDITGPTDVDETADLTINSAGCTSSLASVVCTLTIPGLQPGNYTATLTTYDQTGGAGNVLSAAQAVAFTITAGASNTISLTMSGVPASTIILSTGQLIQRNSSGGYDLLGQGPRTFIVESLDADDNIIAGPGAPTFTISQTSGSLGVTVPSATTSSAPNTFTITPPTSYASGTATISVTPTFTGQATNGCTQSGANCSAASVSVDMAVLIYVVVSKPSGVITGYNDEGVTEVPPGSFPGLNGPGNVAYDPSNGFLYVINGNGIAAYDQEGNPQTLTGDFSGLNAPKGIAYDPNDGYLYVTNSSNNTITAYDGEGDEQTLTGSFSGLNEPLGIAYDPSNGFLYVANGGAAVTAYDDEGNLQVLTGSFSGLTTPTSIVCDLNNGFLYVINENGITAYDDEGDSQTLTGSFTGLVIPSGIAYDPSNDDLYVINSESSGGEVYNAEGMSVASFPGGISSRGIVVVP